MKLKIILLLFFILSINNVSAHEGEHETHTGTDDSIQGCKGTVEQIEGGWVCHVTEGLLVYPSTTTSETDLLINAEKEITERVVSTTGMYVLIGLVLVGAVVLFMRKRK